MNKSLFMQFVSAVIVLASTRATDKAALEKAQDEARAAVDGLTAHKAADAAEAEANALTAEESAKVQEALNLISAAQPPAPAEVQEVQSTVAQE